ncbi:MAG: hypothetical protein EHM78_02090 [Myxococcaceae bacterium]|nr:MAG: hypothetical protein EHM78_02090 [Myxococcaceae bacterium]
MAKDRFYFAYVASGGIAFDPDVHNVVDEDVLAFEFIHTEGEFAQIDIDLRNPRDGGFLKPGRMRWAFLSKEIDAGVIIPIFYGRIVGVPTDVFAEIVTVTFTARPEDYLEQKAALADTLKVSPFYDPIFISEDKLDDPDVVLESRAVHWHVDPVTHDLTVSSIISGEDGTVTLSEDDQFYENMQLTLNASPASAIVLQGTVDWDQDVVVDVGDGLNMMPFIEKAWPVDPEAYQGGKFLTSFTFKGLFGDWPKTGAKVPGGYIVILGELEDHSLLSVPEMEIPHYFADPEHPFDDPVPPVPLSVGSIIFEPKVSGKWWSGETAGFSSQVEMTYAPLGYGIGRLVLGYDVSRKYRETLVINLKTSCQPIVTEPGEDEIIRVEINGNKISDWIGDEVPIGDVRRRKFFTTERGQAAIKYLLCIARANLLGKARAVEITFECPMDVGLEFSLRKNAQVTNGRLPGGEATGKVITIAHSLDGDTGAALSKITFACLIGKDEPPYTESAGTPTYCSADYVGADYQVYDSLVSLIDPTVTELAFTVDAYTPNDDGIDLLNLKAKDLVKAVSITNSSKDQRLVLEPLIPMIADVAAVNGALKEIPTVISLTLKPLTTGPFETFVTITVEDLVIPTQIDLEATA